MLYAAYGSNLSMEAMAQRCPRSRPVGTTFLRDHRLVFRSVADVEAAKGQQVALGIWKITTQCETMLDIYEGVSSGLYRKEAIQFDDGEEALIYVMNRGGYLAPSSHYFETIRQGFRDFDLPVKMLQNARQFSIRNRKATPEILAHHARRVKKEASYA